MKTLSKTVVGFLAIFLHTVYRQGCLISEDAIDPKLSKNSFELSAANTIVLFAIQATLSSCRWLRVCFARRSPGGLTEWIIDLVVSIYLTNFIVHEFWLPLVDAAVWGLHLGLCSLTESLLENGKCAQNMLLHHSMKWLQGNCSDWAPLTLSTCVVYVMIVTTGVWTECGKLLDLLNPTEPSMSDKSTEIRSCCDSYVHRMNYDETDTDTLNTNQDAPRAQNSCNQYRLLR